MLSNCDDAQGAQQRQPLDCGNHQTLFSFNASHAHSRREYYLATLDELLRGTIVSDDKPPPDHVPPDHVPPDPGAEPEISESNIEENIKSRSTWLRLLFMVLFVAIWSVSRLIVLAVLIIQFFIVLLTGETNTRLAALGQSLATYSYQLVAYLTFVTEQQPFPFDDWPTGPPK